VKGAFPGKGRQVAILMREDVERNRQCSIARYKILQSIEVRVAIWSDSNYLAVDNSENREG
jgi:hypothetical protein